MERKKSMTPRLLGMLEAHGALLESLITELRTQRVADDAALDSVFARARSEFSKVRKTESQGEIAHTALRILEEMQTQVLGRTRSLS